MKITLIGSGNVAWHLGPGLQQAGHEVVAIYSPTAAHREALAKVLAPAKAVDSLDLRATGAELFVIAVPDATIASVAADRKSVV